MVRYCEKNAEEASRQDSEATSIVTHQVSRNKRVQEAYKRHREENNHSEAN